MYRLGYPLITEQRMAVGLGECPRGRYSVRNSRMPSKNRPALLAKALGMSIEELVGEQSRTCYWSIPDSGNRAIQNSNLRVSSSVNSPTNFLYSAAQVR
jgi:hypothetical protein